MPNDNSQMDFVRDESKICGSAAVPFVAIILMHLIKGSENFDSRGTGE